MSPDYSPRQLHGLCRIIAMFSALSWLWVASPAHAEVVRATLPNGKVGNAFFKSGNPQQPALLVLHGFLQTYEFLATQNIINGLSALGYTILAPNLSFGVPDRQQSMQCQAAHQHTFQDDIKEIDFWVDWLRAKGQRSVILVGHSWGSQHALGYAVQRPQAPIRAIAAISLVRSEQDAAIRNQNIAAAKSRQQKRDRSLQAYVLGFCKAFMASPESYLSYAQWNNDYVMESLAALHQRKLPVYVVVGSADKRLSEEWLSAVRPRVQRLIVVDGANHFFSSIHEFDLNEKLEEILAELEQAPPR